MKPKAKLLIMVALPILAVLVVGATIGARLGAPPAPRVTTSNEPTFGGPFRLIATDGMTVSDETYRGKWLIIYFGYTFCPDACPLALTNLSAALQKLGSDADKLQALFVTVDPDRDTQQVMAEYLKSFDNRIVGLTGTQDQIEKMVKGYPISVVSHKTDGGNYPVDHSAYFFVLNPQGNFAGVIAPDESREQIADRLHKAMNNPNG